MGIAFSHGEASWSYSGFHRFRKRIAESININLEEMEGFTKNGKSWGTVNDDIKLLLNHSDCDGILTIFECEKIIPRLSQIINIWGNKEDFYDYDKDRGIMLIEGMKKAIAENTDLRFI